MHTLAFLYETKFDFFPFINNMFCVDENDWIHDRPLPAQVLVQE